jgi:hypothetical protein
VKIRTAIFGVYVAASAVGFAILMAFVLREVRVRYLESMHRTLQDTASLLAGNEKRGQRGTKKGVKTKKTKKSGQKNEKRGQ